ncbi:MAG: SMC-Scp complex subunit ScpB [Thermoplasmata archaeon]
MEVKQLVEAALFSSDEPVKISDLTKYLRIDNKSAYKAIKELQKEYNERNSSIEIVRIGKRYVMQLKEEYREMVNVFGKPELDKDVLKTLAIIAYYQPIKQSDLRELVGEKIYEHVKILKGKKLIKSKNYGKTTILSLTKNFNTYFGISAMDSQSIKKYLADKLNLNLEGR